MGAGALGRRHGGHLPVQGRDDRDAACLFGRRDHPTRNRGHAMKRRWLFLGALAPSWRASQGQADAAVRGPELSTYATGPLPSEFQTAWRTGQGKPGEWQVVEDTTASR